jgi:hypothetical protein
VIVIANRYEPFYDRGGKPHASNLQVAYTLRREEPPSVRLQNTFEIADGRRVDGGENSGCGTSDGRREPRRGFELGCANVFIGAA